MTSSGDLIVFEGFVYLRAAMPITQGDISEVGFVVATASMNDVKPDPERGAVRVLIFNKVVYYLTTLEPYYVEDVPQRVVMALGVPMPFLRLRLQPISIAVGRHDMNGAHPAVSNLSPQPAPFFLSPQMATQMAQPAPQLPRSTPARRTSARSDPARSAPARSATAGSTPAAPCRKAARAPAQARAQPQILAFPPQALETDYKRLGYGFDLWNAPREVVESMQFTDPLRTNGQYQELRGTLQTEDGGQRCVLWQAEPVQYLWELVETAILLKKRKPTYNDIIDITEALLRKYSGTMVDGELFVERGYHNVESKITKDPDYEAFLRRVLP
ncbi:hypothetical protein IFR05_002639 [Cadophora sp. M221]|nr:hypothetical protein IFR05_002639 [Cadophora sp. M221]